MWLFWASFGRIQKNLSYLTDNFPKQGYKVLFFPYPAATMPLFQGAESCKFLRHLHFYVFSYKIRGNTWKLLVFPKSAKIHNQTAL